MGIMLEALVSFIFFLAFMHSFQKLVSDFDDFQTLYVVEETIMVIEIALHALTPSIMHATANVTFESKGANFENGIASGKWI